MSSFDYIEELVVRHAVAEINVQSAEFSLTGEYVEGQGPVLHIKGRVLGTAAATLVDEVCHKLEDVGETLLVDLHDCVFFSSVALGFISTLAYQRQRSEGKLVLCCCNDQIKKVIYMLGLGELLSFCEKVDGCCGA